MKYLIYTSLILCFFFSSVSAQDCGTDFSIETQNYIRQSIEDYENRNAGSRIAADPTVRFFALKPYVFRSENGIGGVDLEKLNAEMAYTNTLFAPAKVQFYLLQESIIDGSQYYDFDQTSEQDMLFSDHSETNTINLYFVNHITRTDGSDVCGYAYYNVNDTIVSTIIENDCIRGDVLGTTLPHELGHLFSLYHTHGKTNFGTTDELVDGSNCATAGDELCDTPADPNLIYSQDFNCNYTGDFLDSNGDEFEPLLDNIMSYGRDKCQDAFTQGQFDKMLAARNSYLVNYQGSNEDLFASFKVSGRSDILSGNDVVFIDQSLNAVTWLWAFEGGSPATSTAQNPTINYANQGKYDVSLTITNLDGATDTFTFPDYITVDPFDITYYTPVGWDAPVRFYKFGNDGSTKIYQTDFAAGDDIYLEYGVTNLGIDDALDSVFYLKIYANNDLKWTNTRTISAQSEHIITTPRLGLLPPGANAIMILYDEEDDYPEFDETNNTYETTLSVSEPEVIPASDFSPIDGIEYFIDTEVEFGSGTYVAASGSPMDMEIPLNIPMIGLSNGLHYLYVRPKNQDGRWGQTIRRNFYVIPTHDLSLSRSEYFLDNDPGYGNAIPIALTDGETNHVIELAGASNGYHRLYVRVQNNMGQWSVTHAVSFMKVGKKVDPKLSRLEYAYFDYETSTYSDYISYPIDPVAEELDEVLLLDPTGLVEGKQYTVVVYAYDENGTRSRLAYDNFLYNEIVLINVDEIEITNVLCNGEATGVAAIPASGGSGPLHYSLDNITFQEDSIFNDLTAGNYTVYIKGDDADYLEERTFTIGEPDLLTLAISEIVEPTCPDSENGSITLSGVGGTGTYLFSLDGEIFDEAATFDVLGAGSYTFHLQDENGCATQIGYTLNNQDQDDGPLLEVNREESTLSVSDEYISYQWYRNETALDGQTDTALYVDNYGAYYVAVEKSAGCVYYSDTLEIPEVVIAEISTLGTSCESNHGVVGVRVTSNFQSFEYAIDDRPFQNSSIFYGLSAGSHTVKIRSELYGYFEETQVEIGYEEPTESYFESFTDFPLLRLGNPDQNIGWVMSNGGGYDDDFHLYINFYNYNSEGQEDYYIFSNSISNPQRMLLSFAYAYTKYADELSLNDSLAVLQAIDCGVWQTLDQFGGDEMMTASPINQQFSPADKNEWGVRSIRIEPSNQEYLLAFKAINGYANSLSIDSITLTTYPNSSPVLELISAEIEENSQSGTLVGQIAASDEDGDAVTYQILSGNTGEVFSLDSISGELTVNNPEVLDYEVLQQIELVVMAYDNYGGSDTTNLIVEILDVDDNEAPVIENQTFTIAENSPNGTFVGTVAATDSEGDELTYSIISGNTNDAFTLSITGELTVQTQSALDYETTPTFNLVAEVNDGNGGTASATITVNLNNIDESTNSAPTIVAQTFTIDENRIAGTVVGTIEATDPDGDALTFAILSGNTNDAFVLNASTGELTVQTQSALDYETAPTFNLVAEVNDGNGGTASATITVNLNDVDESTNSAPTIVAQTFTIDENRIAGTIIGTIVASDVDGDALTYLITSGNTNNAFSLSPTNGELAVQNSAELDFETNPSFNLQVEVNDGNGGAASASITVNLTNIDETHLIPATFEIAENSPSGTVIGSVGYFESGTQDVPYFKTDQIDQNDPELVRGIDMINAGALVFSAENFDLLVDFPDPFDFESVSTFKIQVALCCYPFGEEPTETYTINLIDVNEAPSLEEVIFNLDENSPEGSLVGTLDGLDPDGDELTYSIVSGNANNAFSLISNTGELKVQVSSALDFETMPEFNLEVEVMDGNGSNMSATITIQLNDLEEEALKLKDLAGDLVVFPNPFSEAITIQIPQDKLGSVLVLTDLSGREIYKTTINSIELTIPMSSLTSGTYLLSIGGQFKKIYKSK